MANVLIGAPIWSDEGVLLSPTFDASGTWEAGNPLANLQNRRLWMVARSDTALEIDTRLACDLKADRAVRVVCIPKHSVSSAGQWRVVGRPSTLLFGYVAGEDIAARGGVFARTGTATFVDRAGVVRTAADGVPRDGHWINGERTLLLEPSRENLCIRSEEFDTWTVQSGASASANSTVAPDGTTTADTITGGGLIESGVYRVPTFTGDGEKAFAIYLKAGTSPRTDLLVYDATALALRMRCVVTWAGGVPTLSNGGGAGTLYPVEALANGWYRILFSATGVLAANATRFYVYPHNLSLYTGTVYAWGAQAENAVVPSSYIPTAASTVTRNADSLYFDATSLNPPREMAVYVRGVEQANAALTPKSETAVLSITSASLTDPSFGISKPSGATYTAFHDPATLTSASVSAASVVRGDVVELRGQLLSTGATLIGLSRNGGAETASAAGTPQTLGGAWSATRVNLNAYGTASAFGQFAFTHVAIATGTKTMAESRALLSDSGWLDAWPTGWDAETSENLNLPLLHILSEDFDARYWSVQISDPTNADGYVDLARLCITGAYEPSVNFIGGAEFAHESETTTVYADGGNAIHDERALRRIARFTIAGLLDAEAIGQAIRTMRQLGPRGQCVLVLRPDATADLLPETSFLAVPRELTRLEYPFALHRNAAFAFTEEL